MTRRTSARLAARAGPFLSLLILLLLLPEGAAAYDVPYRDVASECYWWELRGVVGAGIDYDVSDNNAVAWREGVENWDSALGSLMHFDRYVYPLAKTHLRWESQPPLGEPCDPGAVACWAIDPDWCQGGQLTEAAIYFDYFEYVGLGPEERIAASAHEWGHNLNLGHPDPLRGMCDNPPRIMGYLDGVGCITGPSCAEQAAVIDLYWLLPWWHDRDGDCFSNDAEENHIGTDDWDDCPDNPSDDAWPPDITMDTVVDIFDALIFLAAFPSAEGSPNYSPRLDFTPTWGVIDVSDALLFLAHFPSACTNP